MPLHDWSKLPEWEGVHQLWISDLYYDISGKLPRNLLRHIRARSPKLRTRTLLRELDAVLQRSGGSLDAYLQMSGDSPENLVARLQEQAAASVAGELVLEAAADQLGIEVSEEEVDEAFRDRFEEPDKIIEQARAAGAYDTERENMRLARALDRIVEEVERIPPEQAAARDAIWTPDKENPTEKPKLWTPGSKEPA
jgi:FKBP-type peptidyl-prolyl cis-trans isomerase (trigger factor)